MPVSVELLVEVLIFLTVVGLTVAVSRQIERAMEQRRRLGVHASAGFSSSTALLSTNGSQNAFFRWIRASTSINNSEEHGKLRQQLVLAGFNNPNAAVWYVIARFGVAIGLPAAYLAVQSFSGRPAQGFGAVYWPLLICGVGLLLPSRFVARRAAARRAQMEFEFPDALDLMVVCVEAGLSLDATFVRVGTEISESHPLIAAEFERVSEQLRAGRSRADALRSMADRTGVPAIRSFTGLLIQTEMLGTAITQTLRTFSAEMRETRFLKAEEKAMRVPVLMTIPLIACILPVIVTVALLPAILDIIRTVLPALAGVHR